MSRPSTERPDLKIVEVVKGGPADQRGIKLKPGDRVISIDGVQLIDSSYLEVHVTQRGDFSTYTLALIDPKTNKPLAGLWD